MPKKRKFIETASLIAWAIQGIVQGICAFIGAEIFKKIWYKIFPKK